MRRIRCYPRSRRSCRCRAMSRLSMFACLPQGFWKQFQGGFPFHVQNAVHLIVAIASNTSKADERFQSPACRGEYTHFRLTRSLKFPKMMSVSMAILDYVFSHGVFEETAMKDKQKKTTRVSQFPLASASAMLTNSEFVTFWFPYFPSLVDDVLGE